MEKRTTKVHQGWLRHGQDVTFGGWLGAMFFDAELDCFGGYPGDIYIQDKVVLVVHPGNESPKYAGVSFYERTKLEEIFYEYSHLDPSDMADSDGSSISDVVFELFYDVEKIDLDQIIFTIKET